MYTAQDIIGSLARETQILKHLFTKVPADKLDRSPAEWMRTIKELLIYTTYMATEVPDMLENGFYPERYATIKEKQSQRDVANEYEQMLDEQLQILTEYLTSHSEEHMNEEIELFGMKQPRKQAFMEIAIKNFPAYRMQLFQYLKAGLGMHDLKTSNLWMWQD